MPAHCAVVSCSDKYVHAGTTSFHRFPFKRKDLLQKWKDFTQRSAQWMPSKWSAVCSRHFIESDFNCSNNRKTLKKSAVPTVCVSVEEPESLNVVVEQVVSNAMWSGPTNQQTLLQALSGTEMPSSSGTKSTCRFCGQAAQNCVSFDNSFELFGMIQKCFPTLQILQDDTLPKDICGECKKQLERFSQFIDVVMLAQSELQRKYRRQPKIKQEPVVRVKQEAGESLDNLFPDELDMGIDEGCEHEPGNNDETEQKLQFCDFAMLNAQDIINNCDIMEIINLDDPFINITDDTDAAVQTQSTQPITSNVLPNVNELLQAEMLTEEHNYAKEDWQLPPHQYKTEKLETTELTEQQQQSAACSSVEPASIEHRSTKPIVTNVSQIPNPMLCELLPSVPTATLTSSATLTNSTPACHKPNIVVLNDSVVQSSAAFRLHNCSLCTAKFFTADSLNQHYTQTHGTVTPMVTVPQLNVSLANSNNNSMPLKLESSALPLVSAQSGEPTITTQTDYWQPEWQPNSMPSTSSQLPKKKIDILDMQRSFLHNDLMPKLDTLPPPTTQPNASASALTTNLVAKADPQLAAVTANYAKLAERYRRLRRKCQQLKHGSKFKPARYRCHKCSQRFVSVLQLLNHKRLKIHFVRKPRYFAGKCCGCAKLFRTRLAMRQHMHYICQSLPLRNTRLQRFKCRYCCAITFTHWRFYRRHEQRCRLRHSMLMQLKMKRVKRRRAHLSSKKCNVCQKTFSSLTGLKQHRITHTTVRRYNCGICGRFFKRRNGLSQHIKGFHLQLKPHECPVCKHSYALKCDMLRCRHSMRSR